MHTLSKNSLDGNLETLIMGLLENEDSYGYALNEALRQHSGGSIQLKEGTLYPLLHRMEKHRWINSTWKTAEKRRRKYYSLTPTGRKSLSDRRLEWEQLKAVYSELVETGAKAQPRPKPVRKTGRRAKAKPFEKIAPPEPPASTIIDSENLPDWLL